MVLFSRVCAIVSAALVTTLHQPALAQTAVELEVAPSRIVQYTSDCLGIPPGSRKIGVVSLGYVERPAVEGEPFSPALVADVENRLRAIISAEAGRNLNVLPMGVLGVPITAIYGMVQRRDATELKMLKKESFDALIWLTGVKRPGHEQIMTVEIFLPWLNPPCSRVLQLRVAAAGPGPGAAAAPGKPAPGVEPASRWVDKTVCIGGYALLADRHFCGAVVREDATGLDLIVSDPSASFINPIRHFDECSGNRDVRTLVRDLKLSIPRHCEGRFWLKR